LSRHKIPVCLFYEWCWDPGLCLRQWFLVFSRVLGDGTVIGCGGLGALGFGSVPVPLFSCFGFRCCVCLF
jgi:hypothetical protein